MIWFYAWCAFLAFVLFSIPIAAVLDNRSPSKPKSRGKKAGDESTGAEIGDDFEGEEVLMSEEYGDDVVEEVGEFVNEDVDFANDGVEMADFADFDEKK